MITQEEILNSEVRALTWKEPFCSAMLEGKINETRRTLTHVRGLVLMCAGLSVYSVGQLRQMCQPWHLRLLTSMMHGDNLGKAIAIGRLTDSWAMRWEDEPGAYVKQSEGLYVHRYKDATPIEPFPWKGSQGWTILNDEQKKLIKICY